MKGKTRVQGFSYISPFLLFMFLFLNCCDTSARRTQILWDSYGVPHIFGKDTREMYYAFGWAQMRCHANLILKLYAEARGRASEYFGIKYLDSDIKMLSFDMPQIAENSIQKYSGEYRSYLEAFSTGMNDYAAKHPDEIGEEMKQILPVTPADIIAHTMRVLCFEFLAGEDIQAVKRLVTPGSNAVAISPSRSASGKAMLLTNPHLLWNDFFTWFEAHLNSEEECSAYGIALVGMPNLSMAFNRHLGWAHTVNPVDGSDRYEIIQKGDGYMYDNEITPYEIKTVGIKVRNDDGSLSERFINIRYTVHGPVMGEKGGKAFAVRIAGMNNDRLFEQYHKMSVAKDIGEFESALRMLQNPMFNVIYADKEGNIMYLYTSNLPKRKGGDFYFWKGTIDGSRPDYIWNGLHTYDEMPKVINPASGFVQNCNDPPWTCTFPQVLDPASYPPYLSPRGMSLRPQRAVRMILDEPSISFDQMIDIKHNTRMEAADRFLDDLLKAAAKYPGIAPARSAEVLEKWDRNTDADSRGAVLFAVWWNKINSNMFSKRWDPQDPLSTPDGLKDEEKAVRLLAESAAEVEEKYGSVDVPWGDVYRLRINGLDYPANGGPDSYGIFRTLYFIDDQDNKKKAIAGETYVAIIEFGDKIRASLLLGYGNATQKGMNRYADQLKMMSEKKLRPALLGRKEILNDLQERETF